MLNSEGSSSRNFLPDQYKRDAALPINHNYLTQQFADFQNIFEKLKNVVLNNDFTLGSSVDDLEERFATLHNAKFGIGVGSGTDAIFLTLKAMGIGPGDEVITAPFTFFATVGAIATTGAKPVFVDVEIDGFNIDVNKIESAVTSRTKAIVPIHWAGRICEVEKLYEIAKKHNLSIVEDACHAVAATRNGSFAGQFADAACFSLHPLKNLNVWGDGGIVITNSETLNRKLRLMRNHGLVSRDECEEFAFNSRLDTIQAVIADHLFDKLETITDTRIRNANFLDKRFSKISEIKLHTRHGYLKEVFHLYSFLCEDRDNLLDFLKGNGIDAKIHYPIPLHLQKAAAFLNHKPGDFPNAEMISRKVLSLPVHEFIDEEHVEFMARKVEEFYVGR